MTSLGKHACLLPPSWEAIIPSWLDEDTPSFDYGGFVVGDTPSTAILWAKSDGVLAGVPFFEAIFKHLGCSVEWHLDEGAAVNPGAVEGGKIKAATVTGPARKLLLGERVALNLLARCSGIATASAEMLSLVRAAGYEGVLAGTRKTTPGFRLVEKYGMLVGGVDQHRFDLSSMVMLKDNHVWSKGSITEAVKAARSVAGFSLLVHVEVRSVEEALEATTAGADIIMLDNFSTLAAIEEAALSLKAQAAQLVKDGKAGKVPLVEVSGGLNKQNIKGTLSKAVDIYSTSAIHQGTGYVDFSLKIQVK